VHGPFPHDSTSKRVIFRANQRKLAQECRRKQILVVATADRRSCKERGPLKLLLPAVPSPSRPTPQSAAWAAALPRSPTVRRLHVRDVVPRSCKLPLRCKTAQVVVKIPLEPQTPEGFRKRDCDSSPALSCVLASDPQRLRASLNDWVLDIASLPCLLSASLRWWLWMTTGGVFRLQDSGIIARCVSSAVRILRVQAFKKMGIIWERTTPICRVERRPYFQIDVFSVSATWSKLLTLF
jgi:hypothetical protein